MNENFELWLEFEHWLPEAHHDPEDDFFNMKLTLPDGRQYAFNVWTFKYLHRAIQECRESGEHRGGIYLPAPDLFVERLDRPLIEAAVADLVARDELPEHCELR